MPGSLKAVIVNNAALEAKYGPAGHAAIQAALQRLIAADAGRQLQTVVFDIEDAAAMAAVGGAPVLNAKDDRGAKLAVDAIYNKHTPDYIMLLDGPDVVPHIELHRVPGVTDADNVTDSDLPYASPAAFSRQVSSYLAVTRVVGRLPAARGETDPDRLVQLIDASIAHVGAATAPAGFFALSADKWKVSTQMSLGNVFGAHAGLFVSPVDTHTAIDPGLASAMHFINCHGARNDWRFYGEQADLFPVAMTSPGMGPAAVRKGAVVAAECCFGAQLYNYRLSNIAPPIGLTYLWKGAVAVMGSTNIAYGPSASNGQADLMAQFFLQNILVGASTGRAMLQARQTFVQTQTMSGHLNLKTLGQFLLLGDPSIHPVLSEPKTVPDAPDVGAAIDDAASKVMAESIDPDGARRMRRIALSSEGKALASAASCPGRRAAEPLPGVVQFLEVARQSGFDGEAAVYTVTGGAAFKEAAKAFDQPRQVAIVMKEVVCKDETGRELFTSAQAIVGHILGDAIYMIEEAESR